MEVYVIPHRCPQWPKIKALLKEAKIEPEIVKVARGDSARKRRGRHSRQWF